MLVVYGVENELSLSPDPYAPCSMLMLFGVTFMIWGILFGLNQIGENGVLIPEFTAVLPVVLLWAYALYLLFTDERSIV